MKNYGTESWALAGHWEIEQSLETNFWPKMKGAPSRMTAGDGTNVRGISQIVTLRSGLQPIPVPDGLWEVVGMEVIAVLVVMYHYTKGVEPAYDNSNHTSTKMSQFFVDAERNPRATVYPTKEAQHTTIE